jgi:hypothetical protein
MRGYRYRAVLLVVVVGFEAAADRLGDTHALAGGCAVEAIIGG